MRIIIGGAGEVGKHAAEVLAARGHGITVIDTNEPHLQTIEDSMDVATLRGNCANGDILREAGCAGGDVFLAATQHDEVNLLAASVAKGIGVKRCIARVHHSVYFEERGLDYRKHLGIDEYICPEHSTALAISDVLRVPGALALENFARGAIQMEEFPVDPGANAIGKNLGEFSLPVGTRLAAVIRGSYVFIPDAETIIEAGDVVILIGNSDVMGEAHKQFQRTGQGKQQVAIMGGPSMAVWLCRALRGLNWSIRLFESDLGRARELANKLEWVTVLNSDPSDRAIFEEEHLDKTDAFVAMAADDETNILVGAWAKSMGARKAVAVAQRPNYLHLLPSIGIDHAFSPRQVAVKELEEMFDRRGLRQVASLAEGIIDVYRVRIGAKSEVVGKPLRAVQLGGESVIAAIPDGSKARLPGPDDVLNANDIILVIGRHGMEKQLSKIFATRKL